MLKAFGWIALVAGLAVTAAPHLPAGDPLSYAVRLVGLLAVLLGLWVVLTPAQDEDDFIGFVIDHEDAVRDVLADARERLMTVPVTMIDDKVCRHAEVILASKYYA